MSQYLRYILPIYIMLYFLFLLLIRAWMVGRKIGKNPVVLSVSDDAHGLIAKYFTLWMILMSVYVGFFAVYPAGYSYFFPMSYFENGVLQIFGLAILGVSLIWTYAAQANMHESWRVGIDEKQETELVTSGIFHYSRNPIYLGMMASMLGLFMVTPNAFTILLAVVGYVLIQIQVRLEEEFLSKIHGQRYLDYKNTVRRFI